MKMKILETKRLLLRQMTPDDCDALYACCKYTNAASIRTAASIGMRFDREYPDRVNGTAHVPVIRRADFG